MKWVNDLKVRLGYGVTGNNGFGNGYTTRMYKANDMWPTNGIWQPVTVRSATSIPTSNGRRNRS